MVADEFWVPENLRVPEKCGLQQHFYSQNESEFFLGPGKVLSPIKMLVRLFFS